MILISSNLIYFFKGALMIWQYEPKYIESACNLFSWYLFKKNIKKFTIL